MAMGKEAWATVPVSTRESDDRLFFDDHQWATVEAATSRIIPTDHHPGAREAGVVRFIDRYLSGTTFIYASARGDGFLAIDGKDAEVWATRISEHQDLYVTGVRQLDAASRHRFDADFVQLDEDQQDEILVEVSDAPPPGEFSLGEASGGGSSTAPAANAPVQGPGGDEGLTFFQALVLHSRQGFYADPVYGGNLDRIGWRVIGFEGPRHLADTTDGSYTTSAYLYQDAEWPYDQHPRATLGGPPV
jgi:gluconate 2-dehydrogenase gamma chain